MGISALLDTPFSGGSAAGTINSGGTAPGSPGDPGTGTDPSGGNGSSGIPVSVGPGSGNLNAGAIFSSDVPFRFPVAINGHAYLVNLGGQDGYQRTTIPVVRESRDQSVETGEQTLNSEGLWRRSQENWVLGGGQYYLDEQASLYNLYERAGENQSLRYRFLQSKGIDIWTSGQISLLPQMTQRFGDVSENIQCFQVGDYLYYVTGSHLYFTSTPDAVPFTMHDSNIQGGTPLPIANVTTDGTNIWVTCAGNGVWTTTAGVTTPGTKLGTVTPDNIGYANGRLIITAGPLVNELNRDGTTTAIGTHKNPLWVWGFITGAPGGIYLGGSCGHIGEIYACNIESGTTTIAPPNLAAPLPPGEVPYCMTFNGGIMCIGTSLGLRIADISSATANGLTYGPVILIENGVRAVAAYGEFAYFSWSNLVAAQALDPTATEITTGLGRVDLGRFTSALIPAYTTDVMAPVGTTGEVTSLCLVNGAPYFTVAVSDDISVASATGLYGESDLLVNAGMVQSGWMRYGTVETKTLASMDYRHDPLDGTVGAFVLLEDGTNYLLPESDVQGSLGPATPFGTNLLVGEKFMAHVFLLPTTDQTKGPVVRRYTLRALVTPKRMDEIILPIVMAQRVTTQAGEGEDVFFDCLGEFEFLKALESSGAIITYQEGTSAYRAYIDRVELKPTSWTDDVDFFNGLVVLRLLTVPAD